VPPQYAEQVRRYYERLGAVDGRCRRRRRPRSRRRSCGAPPSGAAGGNPAWFALLVVLLLWGYSRAKLQPWVRVVAAAVKLLAVIILALCLLEPLFSGTRARAGANLFVVLADNSQSMTLRDRDATQTRAEQFNPSPPKPPPHGSRASVRISIFVNMHSTRSCTRTLT